MLLSCAMIPSTRKNQLEVVLVIVFCKNWYILLRNRLHFEGHFCIFGPQNEGFNQVFKYFLVWFANGEVQIKSSNLVIILMNEDHNYPTEWLFLMKLYRFQNTGLRLHAKLTAFWGLKIILFLKNIPKSW